MKKFLILLLFSVLVLGVGLSGFAQEEHGAQHPPETKEGEHGAEAAAPHEEGPLQTVFKWLNFAVLFGGLGYLLRKPMGEFFTQRRNDIAEGLQRAQDAQAAAHARMDEIEQRLASVSAEVAALRSEAEKEALSERDKIVGEAKREVDRVIERSRQEIDRVARGIEREIKEKVADLVIDRAANTLRTEMTQDDQKRVVVRFIKKL
jgi:F-type H+-transporting ATPase subunit b